MTLRSLRAKIRTTCLVLTVGLILTGCRANPGNPTPSPTSTSSQVVSLPAPRQQGEMSLEEAIARRRSTRAFTEQKLTLEQISQLLWAAQGLTDPRGLRAAPSAGALYPLEVYLVSADGLYHYRPQGHELELLATQDLRPAVWQVGLEQDALRQAPTVFVICAVYQRTEVKYGPRATRYVQIEAGHAAQNLLLQTVALELAGVPIGAFQDEPLQAALSLPEDHQPLYLLAIGYPDE